MKWLLTADLHLTDRAKDSYRFKLFPWLADQQKRHGVDATFILGDLTDRKDGHSSILVNRIIDELLLLTPPIFILKGNHDYTSPENPFFRFLQFIDGVDFIAEPTASSLGVAFLPHQRDQATFDQSCKIIKPGMAVMAHACFDGAIAETGTRLSGLSPSAISLAKPGPVWAGDIHKPQQCGPVTYVGAPYPIRFGDDFTPRVLLYDGNSSNLHFPCLRKWTLSVGHADEILQDERLHKGDHVKVTVNLAREEAADWPKYKQNVLSVCKELKLEVFGLDVAVHGLAPRKEQIEAAQSKTGIFDAFCRAEGVSQSVKRTGLELLKDEHI